MSLQFDRKRLRITVIVLVLAIIVGYPALSVFKAITYTITPSQKPLTVTPASQSLNFEEISFQSALNDSTTLRGWWLPNPNSDRVIIFNHGRDGNRATFQALFPELWKHGYSLLAFDMRGHGQSDERICTWGINEQWDLVGAVNFVKSKGFKPDKIGVLGTSIGAATGLMAMRSTPDIKAGVINSAYADAQPLLAHNLLYPGLVTALRVVRGIDINSIDPAVAITQLGQRHVFLIHGAIDSQVPLANFYKLKEAGGTSVSESWVVPGADHAAAYIVQPTEYMQRVEAFFDSELQ